MRDKIKIVLDETEPYQERYALWSILFVQVDDICFPSQQWYDATSAVLSIWLQEIIRLIGGSSNCVRLPFMDGDYEISLARLDHENFSAKFLKSETLILWEGEPDVYYFARQLLSVVGRLRAYYASNSASPQMKELSSFSDKLRMVLKEKNK